MPETTDYDVSEQDFLNLQADEHQALTKPTPVQIVGPLQTVREQPPRSWSGSPWAIDATQPQIIAGHLPQRSRLVIANNGANDVYLAATRESCVVGAAMRVQPSTVPGARPVEMFHTAEVWAICKATETAELAVFAEFRDGGS
jgi:hypothetical protein